MHLTWIVFLLFSLNINSKSFETKEALTVSGTLYGYYQQLDSLALLKNKALENATLHFNANNTAEYYLKYLILGRLALEQKNAQKAIKHLVHAKKHLVKIPQKKQVESLYYDADRLLNMAYLSVGNYELAYHHLRIYLIAYAENFEAKEKKLLTSLEQKYQVEQKTQVNLLLAQQAKLKQTQISALDREKSDDEQNANVIIAIGIVFMLMILRQLSIRYKLKAFSRTDTLTGLLNRTTLFLQASALVKEANEQQQALSLLVIDVDNFKQINDECDYQTADVFLQKIAKLGKDVMRSRDVFARIGGKTFVGVLPQASLDEATAIALHFNDKVAQANFSDKGKLLDITVSVGVVSLSQVAPRIDSLIKAASTAIEQASKHGYNQVSVYEVAEK